MFKNWAAIRTAVALIIVRPGHHQIVLVVVLDVLEQRFRFSGDTRTAPLPPQPSKIEDEDDDEDEDD
jgi:hypothetical protein